MFQVRFPDLSTLGNALVILLIIVGVYFLLALILSLLSRRIARRLLGLDRLMPRTVRSSPQRKQTLEGLISSAVSFLAFVVAGIATLSLFVRADTLLWIVGLFSAAFGLGARGLVANVLAGGSFIFKNTFTIGEKVEMNVLGTHVEGIVEEVNVTDTLVRSPTGELYVVPNGDIGVIRNFSRASYSVAKLRFCVPSGQLVQALQAVEQSEKEVSATLPDMAHPWQIISTSETMGTSAEVTVMAQMPFGRAAGSKFHLFDVIYRNLQAVGIPLVD